MKRNCNQTDITEKQQMSFEEAKRLSIKKWQMHVDAGGQSNKVRDDREFSSLRFKCGFCERWKSGFEMECEKCEFGRVAGNCADENTLYNMWADSGLCEEYQLEYAKTILEIIKNLEP